MEATVIEASQHDITDKPDHPPTPLPPVLMEILQYNCNQSYAYYMVACVGTKKVNPDIVSIQKPYHSAGVYWLTQLTSCSGEWLDSRKKSEL